MLKPLRGFLLLLGFMTRLPVGGKVPFDGKLLAASFPLAPLAGLLLGSILAALYSLAQFFAPPLLSAVLVVGGGVLLSGALHLDGFADTCDGIYSNRPREQILTIMKDPRVGVFGVTGISLLLLSKTALLSALSGPGVWKIILLIPVLSRMNAVWSAGLADYAGRTPSLAAEFTTRTGKRQIAGATILGLLPAGLLLGLQALAPVVITLLQTLLFTGRMKKRLGGVTGDTIGYTIETAELVFPAAVLLQAALPLSWTGWDWTLI